MSYCVSFPPVTRPDARTLILGSMPGGASLAAGQYYAHSQNHFWPIMHRLLGADGPYEARLATLLNAGIALWDVLQSCHRPGSLDSSITDEVPNDFAAFLQDHPGIERVFFNGGKAAQSWKRHVAKTLELGAITTLQLPSTSPAHARRSLSDKVEAWRAIL